MRYGSCQTSGSSDVPAGSVPSGVMTLALLALALACAPLPHLQKRPCHEPLFWRWLAHLSPPCCVSIDPLTWPSNSFPLRLSASPTSYQHPTAHDSGRRVGSLAGPLSRGQLANFPGLFFFTWESMKHLGRLALRVDVVRPLGSVLCKFALSVRVAFLPSCHLATSAVCTSDCHSTEIL